MTALYPLAIHPWPLAADDLERVLSVFATLGAPFEVEPRPGVPGGPVRVLALGSLPPFVCDAALVKDPTSRESIANALRWVLDAAQPVERGFTTLDYLQAILGPETREIVGAELMAVEAQIEREEIRRVRFE